MKKILFIFMLGMMMAHTAGADTQETFTTGHEWTHQMSLREKFLSLLPPVFVMNAYDVRLRHSIPEYIHWIDAVLSRNPQLENEDVGNIFASTVFLYEPENRQALKTMEEDLLRGDYRRVSETPRLRIQEILEGASSDSVVE